MFGDFFNEMKEITNDMLRPVSHTVGVVGGVSYATLAFLAGVTIDQVKTAVKAGKTTVDEIKEFWND